MKTFRTILCAMSLVVAGTMFFSCKDLYGEFQTNKLKPEDYFSFVTLKNVNLELDYGSLASDELVSVYAYDPMVNAYSGDLSTKGYPFYKGFFDEKGSLSGKMIAPKYADTVYVYTDAWGIPTCLPVPVEDGKVEYTIPTVSYKGEQSSSSTKSSVSVSLNTVDSSRKMYSYFTWSSTFGKITDPADLVSTGDFTSTSISQIKKAFWNGSSSKPSGLDNSSLVRTTDHVNTAIAKAYQDDDGVIHTVDNAHVWLTFVTETGWYQSSLGYYYYKSDTDVSSKPSDLKSFILLPNASVTGDAPYGVQGFQKFDATNAPVSANTKIKLLFQQEDGTLTDEFPAGYTIGYFLVVNGFQITESESSPGGGGGGRTWSLGSKAGGYTGGNGGQPGGNSGSSSKTYSGKIDFDSAKRIIYSNCEWNSDKKSNFVSLSMSDGTLVYGIEDGADDNTDKSYDDVIFSITADPSYSIQDPDKPVIDPDSGKVVDGELITFNTYAFEDLWPIAGDYDMNDVVIEHKSTVTFDVNNYVKKVVDVYTVVNHIRSAELHDAFGVIYKSSQRGTLAVEPQTSETVVNEASTGATIFFCDAQDNLGKSFTVTRTFEEGTLLKDDLETDVDPFIIPSDVNTPDAEVASDGKPYYTKDNRFEVHMPKKEGTSKISYSLYGQSSDAYYVDKDGKHPFAITIPMSNFTQAVEMQTIGTEYYYFDSWVESEGETDNDWYLYYKTYRDE